MEWLIILISIYALYLWIYTRPVNKNKRIEKQIIKIKDFADLMFEGYVEELTETNKELQMDVKKKDEDFDDLFNPIKTLKDNQNHLKEIEAIKDKVIKLNKLSSNDSPVDRYKAAKLWFDYVTNLRAIRDEHLSYNSGDWNEEITKDHEDEDKKLRRKIQKIKNQISEKIIEKSESIL